MGAGADRRSPSRSGLALRRVAAAPAGPRDDEPVGRPGQRHVAAGGPPRRAAACVVADPVRHEAGLDAGDDDGVPLPALGAVERQQLDAAARTLDGERVAWPIHERSAAPSPSGWSRRNSSTAAATRRSACSGRRRDAADPIGLGVEHVVGPRPQP